jgi:hypothetical protein
MACESYDIKVMFAEKYGSTVENSDWLSDLEKY